MPIAYIGLGSNLNDPARQVTEAMMELERLPATRLLARSSLYRSKPFGVTDQPDYINAAVKLDTRLTAGRLMENLLNIEKRHGRVRGPVRWLPRTLDLDLLLYGRRRIRSKTLVVPHPEIAKRNFVLMPLAELSPGLNIPGQGQARVLLQRISAADIMKIS
jgi:2-amino-4-hydroxy-6-hydroxymethyldihydropteridine diphosphokinase